MFEEGGAEAASLSEAFGLQTVLQVQNNLIQILAQNANLYYLVIVKLLNITNLLLVNLPEYMNFTQKS